MKRGPASPEELSVVDGEHGARVSLRVQLEDDTSTIRRAGRGRTRGAAVVAPDLPGLADRTLVSAFERARADKPDAVAQIDRSGEWTYAEAYERPLRIAGGLAALGVGPDARVAALLDNSFDAIHNMFGRGLTGRIQVPINTAYEGRFSG